MDLNNQLLGFEYKLCLQAYEEIQHKYNQISSNLQGLESYLYYPVPNDKETTMKGAERWNKHMSL